MKIYHYKLSEQFGTTLQKSFLIIIHKNVINGHSISYEVGRLQCN